MTVYRYIRHFHTSPKLPKVPPVFTPNAVRDAVKCRVAGALLLAGLDPVIVKITPLQVKEFMLIGLLLLLIRQGLVDENDLSIRDSLDETPDAAGERSHGHIDIVHRIVHGHHLRGDYKT